MACLESYSRPVAMGFKLKQPDCRVQPVLGSDRWERERPQSLCCSSLSQGTYMTEDGFHSWGRLQANGSGL